MPVEPALIGKDRAEQERGPDGCDGDLGDDTRRELFGLCQLSTDPA